MTVLLALINCVIVTDAELAARKAELEADTAIVATDSGGATDSGEEDDPAQDSVTLTGSVSAPAAAMLRAGSARVGLVQVNLAADGLVEDAPSMWATASLTGLIAGSSGTYTLVGLNPPKELGAPFGADPAARGAIFALVAWVDTNKDGAFDLGEQPVDIGLERLLAYSGAASERAVDGGLPAGFSLVNLDVQGRTLSGAITPTANNLSLDLPGALLPQGPAELVLELDKGVEEKLQDAKDEARVALVGYAVRSDTRSFPVLADEPYDGSGDHRVDGPFAEPEDAAFSADWAVTALTARQVEVAAYLGVAYDDDNGDQQFGVEADDVLGCSCEDKSPRALVFVRPIGFQAALALDDLGDFGWLIVDDELPLSESPTRHTDGLPLRKAQDLWR